MYFTRNLLRVLIGGLICLLSCSSGFAQGKKEIVQRLTFIKYPVELAFELKGEPIKYRESVDTAEGIRTYEFEATAEWLNELTIKVRNVSDKPITYINLNLHFPEVTKNGSTALQQIFVGVDPGRKFTRPELRLEPGQTLEIHVSEEYARIKSLAKVVDNFAVENISKVWVEFHAALFDDWTMFEAGAMYRRDPKDPSKWIVSQPN